MKKMLRNTTRVVKNILENKPVTRNSDTLLYLEVLKYYGKDIADKPFGYVLVNIKDWNIPSIETVGRCRRKVQEDYPELGASEEYAAKREELEAGFREYAHEVV